MTEAEIEYLKKKVKKAGDLRDKIKVTEEKIKKINFEISTQQDGSGELNARFLAKTVIPFNDVFPKSQWTEEFYAGDMNATDEEIIALGEFMINALQKRINKWKAELEEL